MATTNTPAVAFDTDLENQCMTVEFATGDTLEIVPSMFNETILNIAMFHGLKQKLGDAAAIGRNPDTGRSATNADKMAAVMAVFDRLMAGEWNKTREGGETGGGLLLTALSTLYPNKTPADLKAWLDGKTKEQRADLRKNPKIAAEMLRIKTERALVEGATNGADMLSELE